MDLSSTPSLRSPAPADIDTLVSALEETFDRVVLEHELKQHIAPVDNYQFFSVLQQMVESAIWQLNFRPDFVIPAHHNTSVVHGMLGVGKAPAEQLCPEGL